MFRPRTVMFLVSSLWVATILIVLVFRGGSAVPVSVEPHPTSDQSSLAQRADLLASEGDYEGAWSLYYQALQAAPEEVSLWYGLGVVLSHLNRRSEAVEAFQYVMRRGRPDSEEVRVARRWLVSAGVPVESVAFAVTADPVTDTRGDRAAVKGKVTWGAPDPGRPVRIQLLLAGLSGDAKGRRFNTRAVLGETYRFEGLPAGSYRLIGAASGQHLWDLTLAVEDGREVVLDLGKDNSSNPAVALSR